jgi:integrase
VVRAERFSIRYELKSHDGMAARALRFAILTAARKGEARGLRWREVEIETKVWTVPDDRMKGPMIALFLGRLRAGEDS